MPSQPCCPVCSSARGHVLYTVDSAQAAQHYVLAEVDPRRHAALKEHIERIWRQPTCDIVECADCGFCFAHPFAAGDSRFYELAYQRTGYPAWKWEYERTLRSLIALKRERLLDDFALLEIGAGDGAFVRRIAPALTGRHRVLCTEFSDFGRKAIEAYGIECRPEDIRDLNDDACHDRFDVVCMFQVLEHMDRLDAVFEQIGVLTRSRAHLFVAVPNPARIAFNERNGSLLDMPPNHVGRWTRRSLQTIAGRHGWRELAHEIEPETAARKLRQYAAYRYLRTSQRPTSLANRIERLRTRTIRAPLKIATAALYTAASLPEIRTLLFAADMGDSQWAHFQRIA